MVTLEEIEAREKELGQTEEQANQIILTPLIQRRYGAGVTPEMQRQAQLRKNQARDVVIQVQQQRTELAGIKQEVLQQEAQRQEIERLNARQREYDRGRELGLKGAIPYNLTNLERKGYREARNDLEASSERQAYLKQVKSYEAQGLKPIVVNGKVTGFEDSNAMMSIPLENIPQFLEKNPQSLSRYEKAGIIQVQESFTPLQSLPIENLQSKPRYDPFFQKVENIIKYPFNKLANAEDRLEANSPYNAGFGVLKPKYQSTTERSFGAKTFLLAGDVASFPVYGLKKLETYAFDKESRKEFKELTYNQKLTEISNIGLSLAVTYETTRAGVNFLFKPVDIKVEPKGATKYVAETKVTDIRVGEKPFTIADFKVTAISPGRRSLQVKNFELLAKGIFTESQRASLSRVPLKELQLRFSSAEIKQLAPTRVTQSVTESFIVQRGRIVRALSSENKPVVFTYKYSENVITGRRRITGKKFSSLEGETYGSKSLRTISKSKNELPKNIQKALEEIETIGGSNNFKIKEVFNKELELQVGDVFMKDLFKITGKGIKKAPRGKTITRGDIASIQKELSKITYSGNQFGLKEIEYLTEKIGVVDITKPRIREVKYKPYKKLYHGTTKENIENILKEGLRTGKSLGKEKLSTFNEDIFLTSNRKIAEEYGKEILEIGFSKKEYLNAKRYTKETYKGYFSKEKGIIAVPNTISPDRINKDFLYKLIEVKPKKALKIEGQIERKSYEYPSKEPLGLFEFRGGGAKSSQQYLENLYKVENQKVISKAVGNVALKQAKVSNRNLRALSKPVAISSTIKSASAYSGLGIYERTEGVAGFKVMGSQRSLELTKTKHRILLRNPELTRVLFKMEIRSVEKTITKELSKTISKEISKTISKEITKQVNKQTNKQISKLVTKNVNKMNPKSISIRIPGSKPSRPGRTFGGFRLRGKKKGTSLVPGYKTFIIRRGNKVYLSSILPKGEALRKGELKAISGLGATFGVQKTKYKVPGQDLKFTPSERLFRGYRISKGKRVPLQDTFIQRAGKRLSFSGEIAEIQMSRRRR